MSYFLYLMLTIKAPYGLNNVHASPYRKNSWGVSLTIARICALLNTMWLCDLAKSSWYTTEMPRGISHARLAKQWNYPNFGGCQGTSTTVWPDPDRDMPLKLLSRILLQLWVGNSGRWRISAWRSPWCVWPLSMGHMPRCVWRRWACSPPCSRWGRSLQRHGLPSSLFPPDTAEDHQNHPGGKTTR